MSDELKPQAEQQEPAVVVGFNRDKPGVFHFTVDLSRVAKPMARGLVVEVDDLICDWYAKREMERQQLRNPGFLDSIRRGSREFLSKFH